MTGGLVPTLVPALVLPATSEISRARRKVPQRPLPVARLIRAREHATVCGLSAVDCHGGIADRVVTQPSAGSPATDSGLRVTEGLFTVLADAHGQLAVSIRGRVVHRRASHADNPGNSALACSLAQTVHSGGSSRRGLRQTGSRMSRSGNRLPQAFGVQGALIEEWNQMFSLKLRGRVIAARPRMTRRGTVESGYQLGWIGQDSGSGVAGYSDDAEPRLLAGVQVSVRVTPKCSVTTSPRAAT